MEITGSGVVPEDLTVQLSTESGTAEGKKTHTYYNELHYHTGENTFYIASYLYTCLKYVQLYLSIELWFRRG